MASIDALPTEVMQLIFAHLDLACKAVVALTCRRLHRVVTSAIYNNIHFEWLPRFKEEDDEKPPIKLFLRTLLETPHRAEQVLTVRSTGRKGDGFLSDTHPIKFRGTESIRVQQIAQEAGLCQLTPRNDIQDLEYVWPYNYDSSVTELLQALYVLPNLHTLKIAYDMTAGFKALSKALQHALCSNKSMFESTKFQHLQCVELCYDMHYRKLPDFAVGGDWLPGSGSVLPFFYLPQLQTMRAVMIELGPHLDWPSDPPCAHALTTLILHRSSLEIDCLADLLRSTPNLCHLTYDYGFQFDNPVESVTYLDNSRLGVALENVAMTLESLVIYIDFWQLVGADYHMAELQSIISGFTSFTGLVKLQRLEVPFICLLGAHTRLVNDTFPYQRLPPNLQHLSLTDDLALHSYFPWRSSSVLGLFSDCTFFKRTRTQGGLAVLEIIIRESGDDWSLRTKSKLVELCDWVGIACGFTHPAQTRSVAYS